MAQTTISINGNQYDLKVTFKFLSAFGIVKNDFENNIETMGNIVMGIVGGDPYALVKALSAMSGKDEETVQSDIENADDLDQAFESVENLLVTSPLTKTTVSKIIKPIKDTFDNMDKKMEEAMADKSLPASSNTPA
ncbi:tail assembly chaperone [Fructobacillus cardui]|uniref:tail assembly chaperone n=1 Tax=Fructobacillus cardui TaxID=2893170 RepID=UPI00200A183F|nr:tail assembly chaperone [Fructobacillus cardui]MCK8628092.1 tail assembly chaperone [Fructobacillus cardui]